MQTTANRKNKMFSAILWLKEKVILRKKTSIMLISRLDLPPTSLRILGSAEFTTILKEPPLFYKYKEKKGYIQNPDHPQGVVCIGLAQSTMGAKKIIGRKLEPPFSRVLATFGTKGAVLVGKESNETIVKKTQPVILKELRSFNLKKT